MQNIGGGFGTGFRERKGKQAPASFQNPGRHSNGLLKPARQFSGCGPCSHVTQAELGKVVEESHRTPIGENVLDSSGETGRKNSAPSLIDKIDFRGNLTSEYRVLLAPCQESRIERQPATRATWPNSKKQSRCNPFLPCILTAADGSWPIN